jgi:hypothetical protein
MVLMGGEVAAAGLNILWEALGKDIVDSVKVTGGARWQQFKWGQAAAVYKDRLVQQHGWMRVLGKNEPLSLDGLYVEVNTLDKVTASLQYDIDVLQSRKPDHLEIFNNSYQRRVNGLKLVQEGRNLFILGKPGAGKTTFLKYLTLRGARGELGRTPIFISLHEWVQAGRPELVHYMLRVFDHLGFPEALPVIEYLLETGRALVMFDGLDEERQEGKQRSKLILLLQEFARKYPKTQVLITCRVAASMYAFEHFKDVEIADFSREQIHLFAKKWFGADQGKLDRFLFELYQESNVGLRELANLPLLLNLLCLTFDEKGSFPSRRAELYAEALDILLQKWDAKRNIDRDEIYKELPVFRRGHLFARIAAPKFEEAVYFFRQSTLEHLIVQYLAHLHGVEPATLDGYAILKAIEAQHSILVERATAIYSFSHLTFQEYYTAKYIVDNEARGTVERLVAKHMYDTRWREVFLLVASMLDDGSPLLNQMMTSLDMMVASSPPLRKVLGSLEASVHTVAHSGVTQVESYMAKFFLESAIAFATAGIKDNGFMSRMCNLAGLHGLDLSDALAVSARIDLVHAAGNFLDRKHEESLEVDGIKQRQRLSDERKGPRQEIAKSIATLYKSFAPAVFTQKLPGSLGTDYAIAYTWLLMKLIAQHEGIDEVLEQANELPEIWNALVAACRTGATDGELPEIVNWQSVPITNHWQSWRPFVSQLTLWLQNSRKIGVATRELTIDIAGVHSYIAALSLTTRCLQLAFVTDKQRMAAKLVRPTSPYS